MSFDLTEIRLADVLCSHPDDLEAVVEATFEPEGALTTFEGLRGAVQASDGLFTLPQLLLTALKNPELRQRFVALLLKRCPDLRDPLDTDGISRFLDDEDPIDAGAAVDFGDPDIDTIHIPRFAKFLDGVDGFRCKVNIAGLASGSGALVSPRLVLTAGHVIGAMAEDEEDDRDELDFLDLERRKIEVVASDTRSYSARIAWVSRCLQSEASGEMPTSLKAKRYCDAALLWVEDPIGREYGHLKLGVSPEEGEGVELFFLVHFPNGEDKGLSIGKLKRNVGDTRCCHTVKTAPGSSGGVGFNKTSEFVGIHQGAWPEVRRLVPFSQFSDNERFLEIIAADVPPKRLWSLTDTPEGHFVIGRDAYFKALNAISSKTTLGLRGVWIRRSRESRKEGLGFSFDIAAKYLEIHEVPHDIEHVEVGGATVDLLTKIHARFFGSGERLEAHAGVATDETTGAAHDEDRARQLAGKLAKYAREKKRSIWLYFEDPGGDLVHDTQLQLEHLAREILLQDDIYLILSGFETYEFQVNRVGHVEALQPGTRALVSEQLVYFTQQDVEATLRAAVSASGLHWENGIITHETVQILNGFNAVNGNAYATTDLQEVAERLRDRLKEVLGRRAQAT